jgi:hypothetical protein
MAWEEVRAGALGRHLSSNRIDLVAEPWGKVARMRVGAVDDVSGVDSASRRSQSVSIARFADCSHWSAGLDVEFGWEFVLQARSVVPLQTCRASSRTTAGTSGSVVASRCLLSCKRVGAIDAPGPIITIGRQRRGLAVEKLGMRISEPEGRNGVFIRSEKMPVRACWRLAGGMRWLNRSSWERTLLWR